MATVTSGKRYCLVNFRKCGELLYGRRFPLWTKGGGVYM